MRISKNRKLFFLRDLTNSENPTHSGLHPFRDWHKGLDDNRDKRAVLRRCNNPQEVLLVPEFYKFQTCLRPYIKNFIHNDEQLLALASIAGLSSHIKQDASEESFAFQLGTMDDKSKKPRMSELRFSQLQKSRDWNEFYRRLRRAIQLLEGKVNLISFADNILHWANDLQRTHYIGKSIANRLQVRWAIDYYQAISIADQ